MVALVKRRRRGPFAEVFELMFRALRKQVVRDAQSHLTSLVQLLHDLVVVRVVLEPTASVDHTCDAEAVQLTHEVAGRNKLILIRKQGSVGKRGIKDGCVWPGDQH